ncbi:type II toxin-antitoxin system Phd/YefM family antitoxin [Mycolicibacterium brumae]|uniref:Antitoxin n=1 Tax=Mycolicibacterium brumae TaxID=85968 RepID=A0A2G5P433_9MYCO|nr:type II toxin-antitoxin system Phd/YefM family antitoxin [Mycolicibacterium brumae]MCV7191201.1 type II toxin-antitoxin system Phd/YefM family antitoxin [Mycolicibacterium brumae]PIB73067.1 type II toxin-antitoxin system Phd/YefM family antitoxin [Mycolicibacterium brumae]RWA16890.1 prevent-host-death protein [Mycolicibacterium brumae DSM 44177]UWW09995.1 type II toxin-antitoxin system Phd/YefM family antitoxin [Mycolicibacterium brumae]
MRTITSTEAKAKLNAVLSEIQKSGSPITITSHGRPVAVITPVTPRVRTFGQLPGLEIPDDFDAPLPEDEIAAWEVAES